MYEALKNRMRYAMQIAVAFTPWVLSIYLIYWLEYSDTWTDDTPHRGKASVAILVMGMGLSFLVHTYFTERARRQ
ncbi:MAG: hypothetical protein WD078_14000 [Woeseia sp.]